MNIPTKCINCSGETRELCEAMYSVHRIDAQHTALRAWENGELKATEAFDQFITCGPDLVDTYECLVLIGCALSKEQIEKNIESLTGGI